MPTWRKTDEELQCKISEHLSEEQRASLQQLLAEFKDTLYLRTSLMVAAGCSFPSS